MANNLKIILPLSDNKGVTQEKLDAFWQQLEEFVNNSKLNSDNIQGNSITFGKIAEPIIDATYLEKPDTIGVKQNSITSAVAGEITSADKFADRRINKGHFKEKTKWSGVGYADLRTEYVEVLLSGTASPTTTNLTSFDPPQTVNIRAGQRPILMAIVPLGDSATPGSINIDLEYVDTNQVFDNIFNLTWRTGVGENEVKGWHRFYMEDFANSPNIDSATTSSYIKLPSWAPAFLIRTSENSDGEELTLELTTSIKTTANDTLATNPQISFTNMAMIVTEI